MAFTHLIEEQIDLVHEPGQWIRIRRPSGLMKLRSMDMELADAAAYLFGQCILSWSYEQPVSAELIAELDDETVNALTSALLRTETPEARKNASGRSTKR